jgi:flagellin
VIDKLNSYAPTQTAQTQQSLLQQFNKLSSGKRVNTAADDPSGYAIATQLNTQAAAASAASENIQNVANATNVAQGALNQVTGILQSVNTLAIQGADSFLSPADRADLQAQANQLIQQANTIASSVNFNGQPLLNGSLAGPQGGTPAVAQVTNNDTIQNGGGIVTQVAATPSFQSTPTTTIQVQVVNDNGQAAAVATALNNATGQTTTTAPVTAGGTITGVGGVSIQIGNITQSDIGKTATIQITAATQPTQGGVLAVQSGTNEGAITNTTIPGVSANALQINNVNLSSPLSSTQAIGQISTALTSLTTSQAQLGAQQTALAAAAEAQNTYGNALTAAASNITDENVGQGVTQSALSQLQSQIQLAVQASDNANAYAVLGLFA